MADQLLLWLVGLVGVALCGAATYILNDIRQSLRDVNQCLRGLRADIYNIDRRVVFLEARTPGKTST